MELQAPEGRGLPEDSGSDTEGGQSTWGYGERAGGTQVLTLDCKAI